MPDLDDLLGPDISRAAEDATRMPTYRDLAGRGVRRRWTRRGSVVLGAAAAVAVAAVGVNQLGGSSGPGSGPARASSTATSSSSPPSSDQRRIAAAAAIVQSPHSHIWSVTVAPGNPDHRISEWYSCPYGTCVVRHFALVVTSDGFAHSHVVELPAVSDYAYNVEPAGADHFVVSHHPGQGGVVDLSGKVRKITLRGPPGTATGGEVVSGSWTTKPVAVNPETAAAHPIPVPRRTQFLDHISGRLWTSGRGNFEWSADNGRHWHPVDVPAGLAHRYVGPIPSADPETVGLLVGGVRSNVSLAWMATLRGGTGPTLSSYPAAAASVDPYAAAVLPDGRLLALVTGWKSWHSGSHTPRGGFYVGQDWAHLSPVSMGAPFDHLTYTQFPDVIGVNATGDTVTVYATTRRQSEVFSSTDGGHTWHSVAAR